MSTYASGLERLRSRALEASLDGLRIVRAALGPEAGAVGAARSALVGG